MLHILYGRVTRYSPQKLDEGPFGENDTRKVPIESTFTKNNKTEW